MSMCATIAMSFTNQQEVWNKNTRFQTVGNLLIGHLFP